MPFEIAASLVPRLDRCLADADHGRPGPVLFEVSVDVLRTEVEAHVLA